MKIYEAGINEITWPYSTRWTGQYVEARSKQEAIMIFERMGFYRNLVVREF